VESVGSALKRLHPRLFILSRFAAPWFAIVHAVLWSAMVRAVLLLAMVRAALWVAMVRTQLLHVAFFKLMPTLEGGGISWEKLLIYLHSMLQQESPVFIRKCGRFVMFALVFDVGDDSVLVAPCVGERGVSSSPSIKMRKVWIRFQPK